VPLFIRIDGRAFHTFTRDLERPFDKALINAMVHAMIETAKEMSGFKFAYHQSDEVTFMLTDLDTYNTQGWFGYELSKVVSLSASLFTAHFNSYYSHPHGLLATFDSRAFSVPLEDAPNVFVWRQQDWERNSLQMLARSYFSQKELEGKKRQDMHEMLRTKGINWANIDDQLKNGTFLLKNGSQNRNKQDYMSIQRMIFDAPTFSQVAAAHIPRSLGDV
jgi:tRNA(His) guanylyltransferase